MRILLLGANGQVGWELQRALAPLGDIIALGREGQDDLCGDLTDLDGLASTVRRVAPGAIVNAGAYTAVDRAEAEPDVARRVNAAAPAVLGREAKAIGALLVHYSTDYVFDGSGNRPWREDDPVGPLSVYGKTKLDGEANIRESGCRHLIFRTSWVYAARGHNFMRTMLKLARERDSLNVVADQIGAPTGAELIADVTAHILRLATTQSAVQGTYHLAARGETSWCGYARFVAEAAMRAGVSVRSRPESILPIPSAEYPTPAPRPQNSRLDTTLLERTMGLRMPPWEQGVMRTLTEILDREST